MKYVYVYDTHMYTTGVDDVYTDPQIHTASGKGARRGSRGSRGEQGEDAVMYLPITHATFQAPQIHLSQQQLSMLLGMSIYR